MSPAETVVLTPGLLREWALPAPEGDKSTRGTVLVVGGSRSTPGAVLLAGLAALRAGAGKLQVATVASTAPGLAVAMPEAMVVGLAESDQGALLGAAADDVVELAQHADVVVIGPGLVDPDQVQVLLERLVAGVDERVLLVVDAYALGALAHRPDLLGGRPAPAVLTPNQGEGSRLLGHDLGDDLDAEAVAIARRLGCVVSLFGHVARPDGSAWRDETGHPGLGTSGSGDVAAGVVGGMLARGADPAQAACWGIHLHAAAGQRLAVRHGRTGFLAREIVDELGATMASLEV